MGNCLILCHFSFYHCIISLFLTYASDYNFGTFKFFFQLTVESENHITKKAYYDFVQLFTENTSNYDMYYLTDLSVHPPDKSVIPPGVTEVLI